MLPARYRMTRAAEFGATIKRGVRAGQADIVIHALRTSDCDDEAAPKIGLVVAKSVGNAVERHRVARRLRHAAATVLGELTPGEQVVIRALPGSRRAMSSRLERQLRAGLCRAHEVMERSG